MSKKTLAPSNVFVTARDPKGRKLMSVVGDAYDTSNLLPDEAQLVNEAPGLSDWIKQWIERHRYLKDSPKEKARVWREATQKAYGMMGMADAYTSFCKDCKVADKDSHWTIIMLKGLTCAKISHAIRKAGEGLWSYYDNLDKSVTANDRDPNRDGQYAIAVRAVVEADEENASKSADQLAIEHHQGTTLMERLLLQLVYFLAVGEHLDVKNWTLCSGSRYADGSVPYVGFSPDCGRVGVGSDYSGSSRDDVRSRSAASLPVEPSGAQA